MFCTKCGTQLADGARFCTSCGAALPAAAEPQQYTQTQTQYQQPQDYQAYQQPQDYQTYQQPQDYQAYQQYQDYQTYQQTAPQAPAFGMKWFKFLIYFGLFAGALWNFANGITLLTGAAYDGYAELVYRIIDGLQTLDILVGVGLMIVAIMGIYARFRLSGYRKNGPKMLNYVYIGVAAVQLIYVIGVTVVIPSDFTEFLDYTSTFTSIAVSIAMVSFNTKYFKERAELFVND